MDIASGNAIGILGGSFNPVHLGHLLLAQSALETFELAMVLFIPCAIPAHKDPSTLLDAKHRLAMLEMALEDALEFEVCDIDIKRAGTSYAIDTVSELRSAYPGTQFFFIIGADTLPELHLWKDIGRLLTLCEFIIFDRPRGAVGSIAPESLRLEDPWPERLLRNVMRTRLIDISSSEIRRRIAEGMSARYLVPPSVEMYIAEHNLYSGA